MNIHKTGITKLKPAVSKATLLFVAGILWLAIGIMLDVLSYSWLIKENTVDAAAIAVTGLAGALIIRRYAFIRIVEKNFERILLMEGGRRCLFSFMPWKSYLLVVSMILMGSFLRHSAIPKLYLAVAYTGIGTALILSGFRYMRYAIQVFNPPVPPQAPL
jgi:hypothetical protein